MTRETQPIRTKGNLQLLPQGGGFLRKPENSFQPARDDVWVSRQDMLAFGLVEGAEVAGLAERQERGWRLVSVDTVCGLKPAEFQSRVPFDRLTAVNPVERIRLGDGGNVSMRIVDVVAPVGKGTRGMIVAQPKTGKTTLLEQMANAVHAAEPDARVIVILIDERPEEVTHFKRSVAAEVLASSSDQSIESHVNLVELAMAQVRCELECGRDVIVLFDSITRMARAFNQSAPGSGRTLTGG
ncbi:transcription termination factor Rho, partial [bacterium]|nr:transcription termination factor Rho [bacterium]